jgi:hypothetical protein
MRSNDRCEERSLDLARDLPTTAEDVAALRRATRLSTLDLDGYLRFLAQLPCPAVARPRADARPRTDFVFEL